LCLSPAVLRRCSLLWPPAELARLLMAHKQGSLGLVLLHGMRRCSRAVNALILYLGPVEALCVHVMSVRSPLSYVT